MQVHCKFAAQCNSKKIEIRCILGENINKSLAACFFDSRCDSFFPLFLSGKVINTTMVIANLCRPPSGLFVNFNFRPSV